MSASATQTTRTISTPRYAMPRLRLRQRSNEHPMAMFAILVSVTFVSLALMPSTQSAFASTGGASAPKTRLAELSHTTQKTDRLAPASAADRACEGQTWGDETLDCLLMIAREGGQERTIRMIADARPDSTAPNVF